MVYNVNIEFLYTGKGSMFKSDANENNISPINVDSDEIGIKVYRFKVSAPGKFYNSYKGTSAGRNKSNSKGKLVL